MKFLCSVASELSSDGTCQSVTVYKYIRPYGIKM